MNRNVIYDSFNKFCTFLYRIKYVKKLQENVVTVDGIWPNSELQNVENDEAGTLLAKLEERWLGLDR